MRITLLTVLSLLVIAPSLVFADLGPKPTADIVINYNNAPIPDQIFYAKMLSCQKQGGGFKPETNNLIPQLNISEFDSANNCYWEPAFLAWGGDCKESVCHFGYMIPSKFKLGVYIPSVNKVFTTNEISRINFDSKYAVNLSVDGSAVISESTPLMSRDSVSLFIKSLVITLIIELLTALIYLSIKRLSKKILIAVFLGSLISLPIVWFVFPLIIKIIPLVILLSEIFAIVLEAYLIHYLNKQTISLRQSFTLSILMNIMSLVIGGILLGLLSFLNIF